MATGRLSSTELRQGHPSHTRDLWKSKMIASRKNFGQQQHELSRTRTMNSPPMKRQRSRTCKEKRLPSAPPRTSNGTRGYSEQSREVPVVRKRAKKSWNGSSMHTCEFRLYYCFGLITKTFQRRRYATKSGRTGHGHLSDSSWTEILGPQCDSTSHGTRNVGKQTRH